MKKIIASVAALAVPGVLAVSLIPFGQADAAPVKPAAVTLTATAPVIKTTAPAPKTTATTKTVCNKTAKTCFTVPATWKDKATVDTADRTETHEVGSTWTPNLVTISASPDTHMGDDWCLAYAPQTPDRTVRGTATNLRDSRGRTVYAVTVVANVDDTFDATTFLTTDKTIATVGNHKACSAFTAPYPAMANNILLVAYGPTAGKSFTTQKAAIAWANGTQHRMAFNVLASARKSK